MKIPLFLHCSGIVALVADAFSVDSPLFLLRLPTEKCSSSSFVSSGVALFAKKASKRKKTGGKSSAGGGFGAATAQKKPSTGSSSDYAVFPALEQGVKETLVPSEDDADVAPGELPNEIYQRLDQIYGFPRFNYEAIDEEEQQQEEESFSFADMLSGSLPEEDDETNDKKDDVLEISQLPPFDKFRVLHVDPLVLSVDDFFTPEECDAYVDMTTNPEKRDVYKTGSLT
jgi:hypothetical protein